jgi:hypothetical protein
MRTIIKSTKQKKKTAETEILREATHGRPKLEILKLRKN